MVDILTEYINSWSYIPSLTIKMFQSSLFIDAYNIKSSFGEAECIRFKTS